MKPLELTVYPRLERPRYGYGIDPYREQWKRERKAILSKRLTDAELAAETYKGVAESHAAAVYGHNAGIVLECDRKRSIAERFATLPHYDEDTP